MKKLEWLSNFIASLKQKENKVYLDLLPIISVLLFIAFLVSRWIIRLLVIWFR